MITRLIRYQRDGNNGRLGRGRLRTQIRNEGGHDGRADAEDGGQGPDGGRRLARAAAVCFDGDALLVPDAAGGKTCVSHLVLLLSTRVK